MESRAPAAVRSRRYDTATENTGTSSMLRPRSSVDDLGSSVAAPPPGAFAPPVSANKSQTLLSALQKNSLHGHALGQSDDEDDWTDSEPEVAPAVRTLLNDEGAMPPTRSFLQEMQTREDKSWIDDLQKEHPNIRRVPMPSVADVEDEDAPKTIPSAPRVRTVLQSTNEPLDTLNENDISVATAAAKAMSRLTTDDMDDEEADPVAADKQPDDDEVQAAAPRKKSKSKVEYEVGPDGELVKKKKKKKKDRDTKKDPTLKKKKKKKDRETTMTALDDQADTLPLDEMDEQALLDEYTVPTRSLAGVDVPSRKVEDDDVPLAASVDDNDEEEEVQPTHRMADLHRESIADAWPRAATEVEEPEDEEEDDWTAPSTLLHSRMKTEEAFPTLISPAVAKAVPAAATMSVGTTPSHPSSSLASPRYAKLDAAASVSPMPTSAPREDRPASPAQSLALTEVRAPTELDRDVERRMMAMSVARDRGRVQVLNYNATRLAVNVYILYWGLFATLRKIWRWENRWLTGSLAAFYVIVWWRGDLLAVFFLAAFLYVATFRVWQLPPTAPGQSDATGMTRSTSQQSLMRRTTDGMNMLTMAPSRETLQQVGDQVLVVTHGLADMHERVKNLMLWRSPLLTLRYLGWLLLLGLISMHITTWMLMRLPGLLVGLLVFVVAPLIEYGYWRNMVELLSETTGTRMPDPSTPYATTRAVLDSVLAGVPTDEEYLRQKLSRTHWEAERELRRRGQWIDAHNKIIGEEEVRMRRSTRHAKPTRHTTHRWADVDDATRVLHRRSSRALHAWEEEGMDDAPYLSRSKSQAHRSSRPSHRRSSRYLSTLDDDRSDVPLSPPSDMDHAVRRRTSRAMPTWDEEPRRRRGEHSSELRSSHRHSMMEREESGRVSRMRPTDAWPETYEAPTSRGTPRALDVDSASEYGSQAGTVWELDSVAESSMAPAARVERWRADTTMPERVHTPPTVSKSGPLSSASPPSQPAMRAMPSRDEEQVIGAAPVQSLSAAAAAAASMPRPWSPAKTTTPTRPRTPVQPTEVQSSTVSPYVPHRMTQLLPPAVTSATASPASVVSRAGTTSVEEALSDIPPPIQVQPRSTTMPAIPAALSSAPNSPAIPRVLTGAPVSASRRPDELGDEFDGMFLAVYRKRLGHLLVFPTRIVFLLSYGPKRPLAPGPGLTETDLDTLSHLVEGRPFYPIQSPSSIAAMVKQEMMGTGRTSLTMAPVPLARIPSLDHILFDVPMDDVVSIKKLRKTPPVLEHCAEGMELVLAHNEKSVGLPAVLGRDAAFRRVLALQPDKWASS